MAVVRRIECVLLEESRSFKICDSGLVGVGAEIRDGVAHREVGWGSRSHGAFSATDTDVMAEAHCPRH
jgi:hypothetical protein